MISYAQNFEDVMLARLFAGQDEGFYIDVGGWHPTLHSVTRHFYDRGWRGINIEPIRAQHALFVVERPRDLNLNVAVGDAPGTVRFFECTDNTALSTASPEQARELADAGHAVESYEVEAVTLAQVFEAHCPPVVDFLKVDVEGFEARVLRGNDWTRFRPRVLVIEATKPAQAPSDWDHVEAIASWQDWEPLVLSAGYVFALFDGLSRFYVRQEEASLARRLRLPPGVFDDVELHAHVEARRASAALQADRDTLAQRVGRLGDEIEGIRRDQRDKQALIDRLHDTMVPRAAFEQLRAGVDGVSAWLEQATRPARPDAAACDGGQPEGAAAFDDGRRGEAPNPDDPQPGAAASDGGQPGTAAAGHDKPIERLDALLAKYVAQAERARQDCEQRARDAQAQLEAARHEQAALQARQQALDAELRRLEQARERLALSNALLADKARGKDAVLALLADQVAGRMVGLKGGLDALYRWRRRPGPVQVGRLIAPATAAGRLHVGVDTLEIVFGVSGGVETYMKTLVRALLHGGYRVTMLCLDEQLEPLRAAFGDRVGYLVFPVTPAIRTGLRLRRLAGRGEARASSRTAVATFARLAEDAGIQVLHSPVQIFSVLDFRLPAVLNLHDLQHLHFPENFRPSDIEARNHLYGLSTSLSDAVVASSEFVRRDIVERMGVPAAKVFTVPVTWNPAVEAGLQTFSAQDARRHYGLPECYALYPAQFWLHKNHARLVEALAIVRGRLPGTPLKLVFTGYRGHSGWPAVAATIERLGLQDHVMCLDYVPVEHLAGLYRGAVFCVMPSLFEASSYPVIEAQLLGCPAMCSNVTSLPELMEGGAGLLFDPLSPQDMADKMARWLQDPDDRARHAERAAAKVRRDHSLERYVGGLGQVYEFALDSRKN